MADFPAICPVSRRFKAAQFPTKRFTSISGAGTTRLYGSKDLTQHSMSVSWLMTTPCADHRQLGRKLWHLPAGYSPRCSGCQQWRLLDAIVPDYLEWHWAEAPTVESLNPGLHRVTVKPCCPFGDQRMILTGADGLLKYGSNSSCVKVRNWSLNITRDAIDVSCLNTYDREYVAGLRSATGSATLYYDPTQTTDRALLNSYLCRQLRLRWNDLPRNGQLLS